MATLHYAPNSNFRGTEYLPGRFGFNLADVEAPGQLAYLGTNVRALVYVGSCAGVTRSFVSKVAAYIRSPLVFGFYLMDEPDALGGFKPRCAPSKLRSESDWIHQHDESAKTFIVLLNRSSPEHPSYTHTYNRKNSHIDLFGIDPYPCRSEYGGCRLSIINRYVAAAEAVGIEPREIVPVFQAFGGGLYDDGNGGRFLAPTPAEERRMLVKWQHLVPHPSFDYAYSWGSQMRDTALEQLPMLAKVFADHNSKRPRSGV
ncbi:MAG: hypothetical protein ACRDVP_02610 [Acidimicrobiales bacterium]